MIVSNFVPEHYNNLAQNGHCLCRAAVAGGVWIAFAAKSKGLERGGRGAGNFGYVFPDHQFRRMGFFTIYIPIRPAV